MKRGRDVQLAVRNWPVIEGNRLIAAGGFAEVAFEDFAHLRLTPNTVVEFEQLSRHSNGETATVLHLEMGTIYVDTPDFKEDLLRLQVGETCITLEHETHLRLEATPERLALAVYGGRAVVEGPRGHSVIVTKNQLLPFHEDAGGVAKATTGIEARPNDTWESMAWELHRRSLRPPPSVWP